MLTKVRPHEALLAISSSNMANLVKLNLKTGGIEPALSSSVLSNTITTGIASSYSKFYIAIDGKTVINTNNTNNPYSVAKFNLETGGLMASQNAGSTTGSDISPDGTMLVVGSTVTPYILRYDATTLSTMSTITDVTTGALYTPKFNPSGTILIAGLNQSPWLVRYDTSTWTRMADLSSMPTARYQHFAFSADGNYCAMLSMNGTASSGFGSMRIYDISAGWAAVNLTGTLTGIATANASSSIEFSPDSKLLAYGLNENTATNQLRVIDLATMTRKTITLPADAFGGPISKIKWLTNNILLYFFVGNTPTIGSHIVTIDVETGTVLENVKLDHYDSTNGQWLNFTPTFSYRRIAGTVVDAANAPVSRTVVIHDRETMKQIQSVVSTASDGKFDTTIYTSAPVVVLAVGSGAEVTKLADSIVGAPIS